MAQAKLQNANIHQTVNDTSKAHRSAGDSKLKERTLYPEQTSFKLNNRFQIPCYVEPAEALEYLVQNLRNYY